MSEPTRATTYNLFEDRGDGKLYLVQVFPTLIEAQRMGRFHVMRAANEGSLIGEVVIVRSEMSEVERITREDAEAFAKAQENVVGSANVIDLGRPKA